MMENGVTPSFSTTINVTDGKGGSQAVNVDMLNLGGGKWAFEVGYGGDLSKIGNPPPENGFLTGGFMQFNSDGSLQQITDAGGADLKQVGVTIPFSSGNSGLGDLSFNLNLGNSIIDGGTGLDGFTNYASNDVLTSSNIDGEAAGTVTGFSIDKNGIVTANFSNGQTKNVYQIPLATFANPNGLSASSGDAWTASLASGGAIINAPNTGAAGGIASGALEGSTVDLATEFTNLITSQRAYSASARIITTADTMLQTLEQLPSQ
jgi:flagellar hook protein FlgE